VCSCDCSSFRSRSSIVTSLSAWPSRADPQHHVATSAANWQHTQGPPGESDLILSFHVAMQCLCGRSFAVYSHQTRAGTDAWRMRLHTRTHAQTHRRCNPTPFLYLSSGRDLSLARLVALSLPITRSRSLLRVPSLGRACCLSLSPRLQMTQPCHGWTSSSSS
jgi:hypothetical protein